VIAPIDLGICRGYEYDGDPARTAIVLPGAMLAGMPVNAYAIEGVLSRGWRAILVWDEFLDRSQDSLEWVHARLAAAVDYAHDAEQLLVIGKSLSTQAAGIAADRSWPAVWLTPLLDNDDVVAMLRRRTAPALLIGGTADSSWDGSLARELSDDVLELPGADHGLARAKHLPRIVAAVAAFAQAEPA
jgi:pimeloyl-ACP methyl ester carboxylesterase